jgi:hypothetical protein
MRMIWDECVFVKKGRAGKVLHANVPYTMRYCCQSPTPIPPHAMLEDSLLPAGSLQADLQKKSGLSWSVKNLFDPSDFVTAVKPPGKPGVKEISFVVYLAIKIEEKIRQYPFEFMISPAYAGSHEK